MILFLMRHGIAEHGAPGQPDAARALTPHGVDQMRRQARALAQAGLRVDRLFCSPYRRARQTADLVAPALGAAVEEDALLQCGCTFADAVELLRRAGKVAGVLFVGHQPDLGQIVHEFTGSAAAVRPGTLAALDVHRLRPMGAVLVGLYDPDVLARLGGEG